MAQGFTDFSSDVVGDFSLAAVTLETDAGAEGGVFVRATRFEVSTYNPAGAAENADVVSKIYPDSTGTTGGPAARVQSATVFYLARILNGVLQLYSFNSGATLLSSAAITGFDSSERYFVLLRVNGTTIEAKAWKSSESQPAGWLLSTTDSTITGSGDIGVRGGDSASRSLDSFGWGTNGDPAPTAPVGGSTDLSVSAEAEVVESTSHDAAVTYSREVSATLESVEASTFDAVVDFSRTVASNLESFEIATQDASITFSRDVSTELELVGVTGLTATISTSDNLIFTTNTSEVEVQQLQATVNYDVTVASNSESIEVTTYDATVEFANDLEFTTNSSVIELSAYVAGLTKTLTFSTNVELVETAGHTATVDFLDSFVRIDGQGSATISTNYGSLRLYYQNGSYYSIN